LEAFLFFWTGFDFTLDFDFAFDFVLIRIY